MIFTFHSDVSTSLGDVTTMIRKVQHYSRLADTSELMINDTKIK